MTRPVASQSASAPKSGENAWLWMLKIVSGLLLVVLLFIHLVVNHFLGRSGLLTYAEVVAYYREPLIPVMEIGFLAVVVAHALLGLRGILLDLKPSRRLLTILDWLLAIAGLSAVAYGIWLVRVIVSRG